MAGLHRETAEDLLHEDSGSAAQPSRSTESAKAVETPETGDTLQSVIAWMTDDIIDQGSGGGDTEAIPPLPTRDRKNSNYCNFEALDEVVDPDEEWNQRLRGTGAAGRLVAYESGDRPQDDLHLRGGAGKRVVVSFVRRSSRAEQAGVKTGDMLVSINGRKDFAGLRAEEVLRRIYGPVTLVFLGFIGKWHAELRLSNQDSCFCGLDSKERSRFTMAHFCTTLYIFALLFYVPIAMGRPDAPLQVIEEIVFQPSAAPLLLAVQPPVHAHMMDAIPGDLGDVADEEFEDETSEFTRGELASMMLDCSPPASGFPRASRPSCQAAETTSSDDGVATLITPRAVQAAGLAAVYELRGQEAKRLVERVRVEAQAAGMPAMVSHMDEVDQLGTMSTVFAPLPARPPFDLSAGKRSARKQPAGTCGIDGLFGGRCER
eukprot:s1874_g2.t1